MHEVRHDVVEQPLVVRDDEHRVLLAAQRVHAVGDDAQRVDVEAGVGLVEDGELRIEHRHLEDLVALLLAAGEAFVDARGS